MLYLMVVNDYQILYKLLILFGGRCEIRTHGTWLRRPVLYPTELIALVKSLHNFWHCYHLWFENGIIITLRTNHCPVFLRYGLSPDRN